MAVVVYLVLFFALTGHSSASYCLCKDGISDQALQKALDYACGAGADCTPILQNGACYQPNTVKSHCDYAVNSYYQRKNQGQGSCDFSGTASPSQSPPTTATASCVFPASPSQAGTSTSTGPTGTTTPSSTTPTTTPTSGTPTTTTGTPTSTGSGFSGLGPTSSTTNTFNDGSDAVALPTGPGLLLSTLALTLWSAWLWA